MENTYLKIYIYISIYREFGFKDLLLGFDIQILANIFPRFVDIPLNTRKLSIPLDNSIDIDISTNFEKIVIRAFLCRKE